MASRNLGPRPFLTAEGDLLQPLRIPEDLPDSSDWYIGLDPHHRVHYHQTLASVRRYTHFKPLPGIIPEDALDVTLTAEYDHGYHQFGEKVDVVLQPTTMGTDRRRRMRNTVLTKSEAMAQIDTESFDNTGIKRSVGFEGSAFGPIAEKLTNVAKPKKKITKYNDYHLVLIGGVTERRHPSNVKLMNSSHHSSQTNAGYSRQDNDGSTYQY